MRQTGLECKQKQCPGLTRIRGVRVGVPPFTWLNGGQNRSGASYKKYPSQDCGWTDVNAYLSRGVTS